MQSLEMPAKLRDVPTQRATPKSLLALSAPRDMRIELSLVGPDRTPVLVVDNLLRDPERVRDFALSLSYDEPLAGDYWPGLQASASLDRLQLDALLESELIAPAFGVSSAEYTFPAVRPGETPDRWSSWFRDTRFGLVTRRPEEAPWVSQPHVDHFGFIAALVYLNPDPDCFGGTVLCRHRATGIQSVPPPAPGLPEVLKPRLNPTASKASIQALAAGPLATSRKALWRIQEFYKRFGRYGELTPVQRDVVMEHLVLPRPAPARYLQGEDERWEVLKQVDMKFNRLVAFPTWQLHGVNGDPARFGPAKAQQRLTMMFWRNWPVGGDHVG